MSTTVTSAITYEPPRRLSRTNTTIAISEFLDIVGVSIPEKAIDMLSQPKPESPTRPQAQRKPSLARAFSDKLKQFKDEQRSSTRLVRMPRDEYEKYWARDTKGRYSGTEPEYCDDAMQCLKKRLADEKLQGHGKTTAVKARIVTQFDEPFDP